MCNNDNDRPDANATKSSRVLVESADLVPVRKRSKTRSTRRRALAGEVEASAGRRAKIEVRCDRSRSGRADLASVERVAVEADLLQRRAVLRLCQACHAADPGEGESD